MMSSRAGRSRSFRRSSRGLAIASPHADDPPPNRTDRRKRESQIARKPLPNPPFLAKAITSGVHLGRPGQQLGGSSQATIETRYEPTPEYLRQRAAYYRALAARS